jgi:hypothetical protein
LAYPSRLPDAYTFAAILKYLHNPALLLVSHFAIS